MYCDVIYHPSSRSIPPLLILLLCLVMLCIVRSRTTLHHSQFHQVKVIRNSEVLLPNFLWWLFYMGWLSWGNLHRKFWCPPNGLGFHQFWDGKVHPPGPSMPRIPRLSPLLEVFRRSRLPKVHNIGLHLILYLANLTLKYAWNLKPNDLIGTPN
jgi:hypothetical protein